MTDLREEFNKALSYLGQQVEVVLNHGEPHGNPQVVTRGQFLGIGDGGNFEILEEDGFVHYCWPMLEIRLV